MKKIIVNMLRPYYFKYLRFINERRFRKSVLLNKHKQLKIVIGSSGIFEPDWIPSEADFLDLLDENDWLKYFNENEIDNLLAEHVWEHLTLEQGKKAASVCYKFLKKGGRLRIAVPDGFHSSEEYINYVKPGGHGAGAHDHKLLYNYKIFTDLLKSCGFDVRLVEYFDENRNFIANEWDKKDGFIHRSINNDKRNTNGKPNYTSLIIDGIKP